jgi:RimJ/RimL family protein N-acetyltransferase
MYDGKLVRLRSYIHDDIEKARCFLNNPDIKQYMHPDVAYPILPKEEEKWFESQSSNSNGNYNFAIETLADAEYIGGCGINSISWKNRHCHVGIFIGDTDYLGKGYGTDAMRILLRFIFNEMNLRKAILEVYDFNERAKKSYAKCGFTEEARLKEEIFRFGTYYDIIRMTLFRRDAEALFT